LHCADPASLCFPSHCRLMTAVTPLFRLLLQSQSAADGRARCA
jgi:hypothetical protein